MRRTPLPTPASVPNRPQVAGPIVAWRAWFITFQDNHFHLASLVAGDHWPARQPFRAKCPFAHRPGHQEVPWKGCRCGIYAVKSLSLLVATEPEMLRACKPGPVPFFHGLVALWGHVIEHQNCYRAEYAYPLVVCSQLAWSGLEPPVVDAARRWLCDRYRIAHLPLQEAQDRYGVA